MQWHIPFLQNDPYNQASLSFFNTSQFPSNAGQSILSQSTYSGHVPQGQVWNNSTLNPSAIYSQPVNQLQHYAQSKFMGPIPAASFALAPLPLAGPISTVVAYASVASRGTKGSSVIPDIDIFASLSADQAARLCKRACRWQA